MMKKKVQESAKPSLLKPNLETNPPLKKPIPNNGTPEQKVDTPPVLVNPIKPKSPSLATPESKGLFKPKQEPQEQQNRGGRALPTPPVKKTETLPKKPNEGRALPTLPEKKTSSLADYSPLEREIADRKPLPEIPPKNKKTNTGNTSSAISQPVKKEEFPSSTLEKQTVATPLRPLLKKIPEPLPPPVKELTDLEKEFKKRAEAREAKNKKDQKPTS
jgi:hypothetical protein